MGEAEMFSAAASSGYVGASLRRKEDWRLLRGEGCFAADVRLPGMLQAVVLRSPHAHARILAIDASAARRHPSVAAIITADDLPPDLPPIPLRLTNLPGLERCLQHPLARDRVRYVGEPVAVVVAADRYQAEDAAQQVEVVYASLPAVASVEAALGKRPPVLHPSVPDNVACAFELTTGDVEATLARADMLIEERYSTNRLTAAPLECRGLAAHSQGGRLTVWGAAKVPHFNRSVLARLLGLAEDRVRLVENDVGGGFGARGEFYPEDYLIPFLAMRLERPVGWVEDRREHLVAINHSRQQEVRVRAGVAADGTLLGLDVRIDNDHGAYVRTHGATVPEIGATLLPGPYRVPHYRANVRCVLTNKTPTGTYRGPGRYEGTFVRERLMDSIARRLGLDPAEVRRRNLIAPTELPYDRGTSGLGVRTIYDTGDYPALLDTALEAIDYTRFRTSQTEEQRRGRWLGAGMAAFVEKSGLGPWEYARVEVEPNGRVVLFSGGASVGQGMETALAQITADGLGVHPDQVEVVHGDTDRVARGNGAFASRLTVVGGSAAFRAAHQVRDRVLGVAARRLEVAPDDLEVHDGVVHVRGAPARALELAEVARAARADPHAPELRAEDTYPVEHMTYPGGVHACVVEVDLPTGQVRIDRYAIAYDIGRAVNPMLVAGQLQGGLAQGIGGALLEELVYGTDGQPLTSTLMDYLLTTSQDVPDARLSILETTPTPLNPLGVKGVGEGGCTGVGACIANAIEDALAPLEVTIRRLPLAPAEVRRLIREAQA